MEGIDEVIKEFLVESYESLDQLDSDLVALEDAPEDRDRLASIFRTVHTIKGTSGFLALPKLERVAHVGENLLVPLRDGELQLNADIASGLLSMVDAIREILGMIEEHGSEGDSDFEPLVARLQTLLDHKAQGGPQETPPAAPSSEAQKTPMKESQGGPAENSSEPPAESEDTAMQSPEAADASADATTAEKSQAKKSVRKTSSRRGKSVSKAKTTPKAKAKSKAKPKAATAKVESQPTSQAAEAMSEATPPPASPPRKQAHGPVRTIRADAVVGRRLHGAN